MESLGGREIPEHVVVEKTATDRSGVEPGGTGGLASALGSAGTSSSTWSQLAAKLRI